MSEEGEFDESAKGAGDEELRAGVGGDDDGEEDEEEEEEEEEEGEHEDKEMLFLIEFLVDTLCINSKNLNTKHIDPCMLDGQTCVVLAFLNFPAMNICEKDWGAENEESTDDVIKFSAGKSLMFALSESQLGNRPPIYLNVSAHKMMPHASPEPKLPIGMTKICLSELFKQVFEKVQEKPDKLPLSKSIKDSYQLMGSHSKKPTGEIVIYIRLSCLGQNVVTEFQRGGDECEPFLFKNKESNKVYECKAKDDDFSDEAAADLCPPCPGWGDSGEKSRNHCSAVATGSLIEADEDEYEEFGTEVHGHALTIKIQKSKKSGGNGTSDSCVCSGNKTGTGSGRGNQVSFELPRNQSLCKGGFANGRAKITDLKGCNEGKDGFQVSSRSEESEDKDIFVLRIGKKGETSGKGKLELELRTPKQKVDRGPKGPKMVDREAQTDREEAPKKGKKKK